MKLIFAVVLCFTTFHGFSQKRISLNDINNYIGDSVEVRGLISEILKTGKGKNYSARISVGGVSPNEKLSVWVKSVVEGKSDYIFTDDKYKRSVVIVKGKVTVYNEKPRIVVGSPNDLIFVIDE